MKRFQDLQLKTMIKNAKEAKEGKKGSRPDQGHNPQQSYENFQEKKANKPPVWFLKMTIKKWRMRLNNITKATA